MWDDLFPVLLKFHREVFLPDFTHIVEDGFGGLELRMNARVDELNRRLAAHEVRDLHRTRVAPPPNE